MGLVSRIATEARVRVHRVGNMDLIAAQELDAFFDVARSWAVHVLGLEGFHLKGEHLVPEMDAIADFSSLADSQATSETTIREAREFAASLGRSDLFFDVTLRSPTTYGGK